MSGMDNLVAWQTGTLPEQPAQATCEHHYKSVHQPDFPPEIYWVQVCTFCGHLIPELRIGKGGPVW